MCPSQYGCVNQLNGTPKDQNVFRRGLLCQFMCSSKGSNCHTEHPHTDRQISAKDEFNVPMAFLPLGTRQISPKETSPLGAGRGYLFVFGVYSVAVTALATNSYLSTLGLVHCVVNLRVKSSAVFGSRKLKGGHSPSHKLAFLERNGFGNATLQFCIAHFLLTVLLEFGLCEGDFCCYIFLKLILIGICARMLEAESPVN